MRCAFLYAATILLIFLYLPNTQERTEMLGPFLGYCVVCRLHWGSGGQTSPSRLQPTTTFVDPTAGTPSEVMPVCTRLQAR
jgi:hypothetical protein